MKRSTFLSALTVVAVSAATLSTAAMADRRGGPDGREAGGMPMLNFAEIDANKDGKITQDEITAFHTARLTAADTNGDGILSVDELSAMSTARMQARMKARSDERAAKMLKLQDADGDGKLTMAEATAAPDRAARMFARVDTDKDGALSQAEVDAAKAMMMKHRGHRGKHGGGADDADATDAPAN